MALNALLKFTQGVVVGGAGEALAVTPGVAVTIENSSGATDLASWKIELLYAPFGSAEFTLIPVVKTSSSTNTAPIWVFTPDLDVYGCYRIRLTVYSLANFQGQFDVDIRNVVVLTARRSLLVPPPMLNPLPLPASGVGSKPNELNVHGQLFGWAGGSGDPKVANDLFFAVDQLQDLPDPLRYDSDKTLVLRSNPLVHAGKGLVYGDKFYLPQSLLSYDPSEDDLVWRGICAMNPTRVPGAPANQVFLSGSYEWPDLIIKGDDSRSETNYRSIQCFALLDDAANNRWLALCTVNSSIFAGDSGMVENRNNSWEIRVMRRGEPMEWLSTHVVPEFAFFGYTMFDAIIAAGYIWLSHSAFRARISLSNFALVDVQSASPSVSMLFYDARTIYGDGEGRVLLNNSYQQQIVAVRPSTNAVTHTFSIDAPSQSIDFNVLNLLALDAATGRIWFLAVGTVSSTSSVWLGTADLDVVNLRIANVRFLDVGSRMPQNVYNAGGGQFIDGRCLFIASHLTDITPSGNPRVIFCIGTDNGVAISITTLEPSFDGVVPAYYNSNTQPIITTDGDTMVAGATSDSGYWVGAVSANPAGYLSLQPGVWGPRYVRAPWLGGDLSVDVSGYNSLTGTQQRPLVTGLLGARLANSVKPAGAITQKVGYGGSVTFEADFAPLVPSGTSLPSGLPSYYEVDSGNYNGMLFAQTAGSTGSRAVRLRPNKSADPSSNNTLVPFRFWFGGLNDSMGQVSGSTGFEVVLDGDPALWSGGNPYSFTGEIRGLTGRKGTFPKKMRLRNSYEFVELQFAGRTTGINGHWVVANRYRPWEHVAATAASTTLFVGHGIVRVASNTGAKTITLPTDPDGDDWIIVKDTGNQAGTNAITIAPQSGQFINGTASNFALNWNGGTVVLRYDEGATNWEVIATYGGAGGGSGADEKVKVSATDTTTDYLYNKFAAGVGTSVTKTTGGNEFLSVNRPTQVVQVTLTAGANNAVSVVLMGQRDVLLASAPGAATLNGMIPPAGIGQILLMKLINQGTFTITVAHNSGLAVADRRFRVPGGGDLVLQPDDCVDLFYDTVSSIWRVC